MRAPMTADELIEVLRGEGPTLAAAAARADLDVPVPTCPGWRMRDLVRHVGGVHRWARTYVATAWETMRENDTDLEALVGGWPHDEDLLDWFREGHVALVDTLEAAPTDLACWTFLPAPSPRAFWARRQAHETAVHRADAELATGPAAPAPPAFAADGLDELLMGFLGRRRAGVHTAEERTFDLRATDLGETWHVRLTAGDPGRVVVEREHDAAECTVAGTAWDLYLLAWNRRDVGDLAVDGDPAVLSVWRDQVRITWS